GPKASRASGGRSSAQAPRHLVHLGEVGGADRAFTYNRLRWPDGSPRGWLTGEENVLRRLVLMGFVGLIAATAFVSPAWTRRAGLAGANWMLSRLRGKRCCRCRQATRALPPHWSFGCSARSRCSMTERPSR